jgi:hypothetical protein
MFDPKEAALLRKAELLIIQAGFVPDPDNPGEYIPPPGGFADDHGEQTPG